MYKRQYYDTLGKARIVGYEAHGGGLRDEYVEDHIKSLGGTVNYYKSDFASRGEPYEREVEVVYVAHDTSRLSKYRDGYSVEIGDIPFTFRFETFWGLLEEVGGIDAVCSRTALFDELIHQRVSRLPDAYALKRRYREIVGI